MEQDPAPATERNEHRISERIHGSDLMVTEGGSSGVHQLLDQIQTIASQVFQFTHKWREIQEEYAALGNLLKKRAVELDLKERSVMERIVEVEKKEEQLKNVEERERKVDLLDEAIKEKVIELEKKQESFDAEQMVKAEEMEVKRKEKLAEVEKKEKFFEVELIAKTEEMKVKEKQLEEREKELELKQRELEHVMAELEEKGREVERISKCNHNELRAFDLKQKESLKQLEAREKKLSLLDEAIKEKANELEKKEEIFVAEQKAKAEETELKCREKLAEVEKKEKFFEVELKAKAEEMDVKEKKLDEREKELDLKQRELEQVMDKLKDREKETNPACLASASASSPQQRDRAYEEEAEEEPEIPDSEFHDFKKTMSSFVVGKTWALYDTQDEMPRLYAKIKRVNKSQLSLNVTWLDPKDDESVPVACGRFTYGRTGTVSYLTFSHEVKPVIHGRNISVNPKEGETWALFRDWSQSWENNSGQHKTPYKYDLVEVLEVYEGHRGVGVTYLGKVEGFVSVFKHAVQHGEIKRVIEPKEMQRFSHRVPSVRLNGEEKEGVPGGSFELDPAAVPRYILLGGEGT
ncbi:hypothetical protein Bca4012_085889 [Brassica carinata]